MLRCCPHPELLPSLHRLPQVQVLVRTGPGRLHALPLHAVPPPVLQRLLQHLLCQEREFREQGKERCGRRLWGLRGESRKPREVSRIERISVLFPPLLAPDSPLSPMPPYTGVLESPGPQQVPTSSPIWVFNQKCPDPNCKVKKSLHGHHPRDCLFYLRDWTAVRLQKLLQVRGGQPAWVDRLLGDRVQEGQGWKRLNTGKRDGGWMEANDAPVSTSP